MALDPQRHYSVVEDFDGLHIVPTYRVIRGGETLLFNAGLLACRNFVAAYLGRIAAGQDPRTASTMALASVGGIARTP